MNTHGISRQRLWSVAAIAGGLVIALLSPAQAVVPERMHYQGYLTLTDGTPVECADPSTCATPFDLTFRIYSDPLTDALLWEEDHLGVSVVAGVFNVTLGSDVPITPDLLEGPAFLGVEVNGNEELQPRQELVSAAFALRCAEALNAQNLGGVEAENYVTNAITEALQEQITALEEKLTALEETVAQGGSNGGGADPNAPLINGVHTAGECSESGGLVTEIPGPEILCRFAASSCPSEWTQLDNWSTTQSTSAGGKIINNAQSCQLLGISPTTCSVSGHPFLDQPPSTCCATNVAGDEPNGKPTCFPQQVCATSPIVEIGCF